MVLLELVESLLDREVLRLPALGFHSFQIMRIILKVCQTHQATIKNSSIPYDISKASVVFEIAETRNSKLQKITTIASKMFHQRKELD